MSKLTSSKREKLNVQLISSLKEYVNYLARLTLKRLIKRLFRLR